MGKNNHHKKEYEIDEFARQFYCQKARLRQLRKDKHMAKKRAREKNRRAETENYTTNCEELET